MGERTDDGFRAHVAALEARLAVLERENAELRALLAPVVETFATVPQGEVAQVTITPTIAAYLRRAARLLAGEDTK